MKPAERANSLPPYIFATIGKKIAKMRAEGIDVIRMDIGSPDLPPTDEVIDALTQSARNPNHHRYPGYSGKPELLTAIADYYARRFNVTLDPQSEVVTLIGSKEGLANLNLAWLDSGDVCLASDPGYPTYAMGARLANGTAYPVPLLAENGWQPDFAAIPEEVARKARMLWLNYPNNPTGAIAAPETFAKAVEFARKYDVLICHDAPYTEITYDGYVAPSFLETPGAKEVGIEFNSLSKSFSMAGWRIGMAVGNATALAALAKIKSNIDSGIFLPIQDAAIAALNGDPAAIDAVRKVYQERRDAAVAGLRAVGFEVEPPKGAFYLWIKVPAGYTSTEFTTKLLDEGHLSFAPGTAYGARGEGYMRVSLVMPVETINAAMERLKAFMER